MLENQSICVVSKVRAFAVVAVVFLIGGLSEASAALRAGTATVNITADKPTKPIHDPLRAKVLVVEDGSSRAVIIAVDLIEVSESFVKEIRLGVEKELGFDPSTILINASHNHRTGGQEAKDVTQRIIAAVKEASRKMVPAKIGVGVGLEDRITMNRRLRMKDGSHWTIRHATPLPSDADVAGLGPCDPQIGLLRVDTLAGRPLALVYNFAGHPYAGVTGGGVTADFPGFASAVIEKAWPGAVALFLQGAAGDITPIRFNDFQNPQPTQELGTKLGLSTLQAAQGITTDEKADIRVVSETVMMPRRTDTDEKIKAMLAEQEKILQFYTDAGNYSRPTGTALNFESFLPLYLQQRANPEHPSSVPYAYRQEESIGEHSLRSLDKENAERVQTYRACITQMDRLITLRTNMRLRQKYAGMGGDGPIPAEIQAMKIGGFVLVTLPAEPFVEVGLHIKKQSPFPHTFMAGYSNGMLPGDYAPTAESYDKMGYEESCSELAPQWQAIYEKKALELIRQLDSAGK